MLLLLLAQLAASAPVPLPAKDQGTISAADYPREAARNGWEGDVHLDLTIDTNGRVKACTVTQSSGHSALDEGTCKLMADRARFKPAVDSAGKAIEGHFQTQMNWRLGN